MEAQPRLVGGHVALDFVNSVDDDVPIDYLGTLAGFDAWRSRLGLPAGRVVLRDVHAARACLDAVFRPLAMGEAPPRKRLDELARLERDGLAGARLEPGGWRISDPLALIVHAGTDLLQHGPLERLKHCGHCPWLFLDHSRNGSRRWCSMEGCGTEVKIARLTERRRARA